MSRYTVAFFSDFDRELVMCVIHADNELEAAKQFLFAKDKEYLDSSPDFSSLEELKDYCANGDAAIEVMLTDGNDWRERNESFEE